jgi:F420-0:gamma-glutamyl ligase
MFNGLKLNECGTGWRLVEVDESNVPEGMILLPKSLRPSQIIADEVLAIMQGKKIPAQAGPDDLV